MDYKILTDIDVENNKEAIIRLIKNNYEINFDGCAPTKGELVQMVENIKKYIIDNSAIILGAMENEGLKGFLWAYKRQTTDGERLHISHIIVDERQRGSGIGKRLIKNLEEIAQHKQIKIIELITTYTNRQAIDFYQSNQYEIERVQLFKKL